MESITGRTLIKMGSGVYVHTPDTDEELWGIASEYYVTPLGRFKYVITLPRLDGSIGTCVIDEDFVKMEM